MTGIVYDAAKEDMLTALGITWVSLHTDDPTSAALNEVATGVYARQSVTWNSASGSAMSASNTPQFTVPAGTTITHIGFFASTVFYASEALATPLVFPTQDTLDLDAIVLALRDPSFYS